MIKYELVAYDVAVKGKRNRPFVKEDHEPANLTEEFRTSDHPVQEPKTTKQQEVIKVFIIALRSSRQEAAA